MKMKKARRLISILMILTIMVSVSATSVHAEGNVGRVGQSKVGTISQAYTGGSSQVYAHLITRADGTKVRYVYSKNYLCSNSPENTLGALKSVLTAEFAALIPDKADEGVGFFFCSDPSLEQYVNENWTSAEYVARNVLTIPEEGMSYSYKREENGAGGAVNTSAMAARKNNRFEWIKTLAEAGYIARWEAIEEERKATWDAAEAEKHEADPTYIPQQYQPSTYVPLDFGDLTDNDIQGTRDLTGSQIDLAVGCNLTTDYNFEQGRLVELINIEIIDHVASIYSDHAIISESSSDDEKEAQSATVKVDVGGLSDGDITDDLRGKGYDSVESIESALQTALSIETEEKKENSELVDAKLMISTDGGKTWQEATLENFPEEGINAILPYPDGTNGNEYSFSVAHMIGAGDRAGEIETPSTTNTASGISVHFNGLSPVMITWTKNSSPSKDDSKSEEKAHTHHYVWETVEATENSDGELRYKCDICGDIQTRVPITAYYIFNKNTSEKIRKAGQGATVKIETSRWISFHKMVMQALVDRPDVSLEVSFLDGEYKGNRVSFIVPAGTDTLSLLDENGFSGFLYLAGKFGTAN